MEAECEAQVEAKRKGASDQSATLSELSAPRAPRRSTTGREAPSSERKHYFLLRRMPEQCPMATSGHCALRPPSCFVGTVSHVSAVYQQQRGCAEEMRSSTAGVPLI